MSIQITKLTKKQKEAMPAYRDMWIEKGLKTGETDWDTFDKYMPICYEAAGLVYPKNVVRVQSPLVGGLAASIAQAILQKKGDAVGGAVDDAVRDAVRDAVDGAVDDAVRDAVDDAVRDAVDDAVGDAVNDAVRDAVRDAVDGAVDDAVDILIKTLKKTGQVLSWHCWLGGQFWVGGWYWGVAFVNFFFDICKLKLSKDIMKRALAYRKVCESVNYIWPNRDFVMVCARPKKINRDDRGRPHSETEKSIEYPDGWGLYHLHGVKLEKEWWEKIVKDQMSPDEIFAIDNIEHRRIAYEYMDKTKMKQLKDYKVLDEQIDGKGNPMKIISFTVQKMDEPLKFYNCICPSTGREYFIGTDKNNCLEAKNASFGLDKVEYADEW
jgi:hypothetical protein